MNSARVDRMIRELKSEPALQFFDHLALAVARIAEARARSQDANTGSRRYQVPLLAD
jgi:hypothetical protein